MVAVVRVGTSPRRSARITAKLPADPPRSGVAFGEPLGSKADLTSRDTEAALVQLNAGLQDWRDAMEPSAKKELHPRHRARSQSARRALVPVDDHLLDRR